jgi:hypothetical protein
MSLSNLAEIWHPYWDWEEISHNMWGDVTNKKEWLQKAIEFTGDDALYGKYMLKVVDEWKISCEHNLTKTDINKKAWIGHAAAALALKCPEDIVREAWGYLTRNQQDKANMRAQEAINYWEIKQCRKLI